MKDIQLPLYGERLKGIAVPLIECWYGVPRALGDAWKALCKLLLSLLTALLLLVMPLSIVLLPLWVFIADRIYLRAQRKARAQAALDKAMGND
jgi:hypothetical protein